MKITRYLKGDRIIWLIIIILMIVSLLSVYSSTGSLAYKVRSGNTFYYLARQFKFALIGFIIIFFVHLIPYQVFSKFSAIAFYITLPLLLFTLFFGSAINEASRWLQIPGTGLTIQTSDLAKVTIIMYMAKILSVRQNEIGDFKGAFLRISLAVAVVCLLILPANLSTAVMVFVIALALMFVGRVPFKYLAMLVGAAVFGLAFFVLLALAINKEGRITTWKNRIEAYVSGEGNNFQADQAKVAIVRGGLLGKGAGNSTQRNLLPHPYSDFIYAIIIEEYGSLIGGILMVALYLWLFFRSGLIIRRSRSTYGAFLVFGLSLTLVIQAFINMAVAVGLVPVTGQTLPMVSMGGSSILFTSLSLGMILSVSWGSMEEMAVATVAEGEAVTSETNDELKKNGAAEES